MAYSYLALGDSYTVGEQVLPGESFAAQTVHILNRTAGNLYHFDAPAIIAQTGWTTDELDAAIEAARLTKTYDIVSLLIGVNNQYRGRSVNNFKFEFEHLLQKAVQFAGNKAGGVFILSIPDWGVTPFAAGRDREKIASEIDAYNLICETSAAAFKTNFINITASQRADSHKPQFLTQDGLHPSGKEYQKWALKLAELILTSKINEDN